MDRPESKPASRYLTNEEAAYLKLSPHTLNKKRVIGGGLVCSWAAITPATGARSGSRFQGRIERHRPPVLPLGRSVRR